MAFGTRQYMDHNQKAELVMWMRRNKMTLDRDKLTLHETASKVTKALGFRVSNAHVDTAARAIGHVWPKIVGQPVDVVLDAAVMKDPPPIRVDVIPQPPKKEELPVPQPQPPPAAAKPSSEDELIQMMTQFAMLKNQIIDQSRKLAEAQRFLKEAETMTKVEQESLNTMMREQIRLRSIIKEAMEI